MSSPDQDPLVPLSPDYPEVAYVLLLFGLFVVPRMLQRYRIPAAITSLLLGALAGPVFGLFLHDRTIELLSTLGIVSLFLFAGLDVEVDELKEERRIIAEHLVVRVLALAAVGAAISLAFTIPFRPAILVSLAVLTPSTGFILDILPSLKLSDQTRFWVRATAIATELLALAILFVTLQSATPAGLLLSAAVMAAMVLLLPIVFRGFARFIVPWAPRTEFAFLLMVAVVCAFVTRDLGVYYLVGAFVVGMVAQGFREQLPAMASERMLHAVEAFGSIFVPFYFFHAGLVLRRDDLSLEALAVGAALLVLGVPLRLLLLGIHRRIRFGETLGDSLRVGVPMLPTLVFTLVIAQILREVFSIPPALYGGLVVYALGTTVIPSLVKLAPPPEYESLQIQPLPSEARASLGLPDEEEPPWRGVAP
jgi:Kef-type K+ transport system membrane component KefB